MSAQYKGAHLFSLFSHLVKLFAAVPSPGSFFPGSSLNPQIALFLGLPSAGLKGTLMFIPPLLHLFTSALASVAEILFFVAKLTKWEPKSSSISSLPSPEALLQ